MIIIILILLIVVLLGLSGVLGFYCWKLKNSGIHNGSGGKADLKELQLYCQSLEQKLQQQEEQFSKIKENVRSLVLFQKDLSSKLKRFNKTCAESVPFREKIEALQCFWLESFDGCQFFVDDAPDSVTIFDSIFNKMEGGDLLKVMQANVTTPFYFRLCKEKLQPVEVREMVVKMAMQLYDEVSSYLSPNQRDVEQGLNMSIVRKERKEEEAYLLAKEITNLESVTPFWIRNLSDGLRGLELEDKMLIFSGYRYPSIKQVTEPVEQQPIVEISEEKSVPEAEEDSLVVKQADDGPVVEPAVPSEEFNQKNVES